MYLPSTLPTTPDGFGGHTKSRVRSSPSLFSGMTNEKRCRNFGEFIEGKLPQDVGDEEGTRFLSALAIERRVSVATQRKALNNSRGMHGGDRMKTTLPYFCPVRSAMASSAEQCVNVMEITLSRQRRDAEAATP